MMPKIVDKEAKKKEIVQSSLGVFAKKGFKDTIMSDIAMSAGIGKGTIYEYFPNKQAIFIEAFGSIQRELDSEITASVSSHPDPGKKLTAFIGSYCRFYEKLPEALMIYIDVWVEAIKSRKNKIKNQTLALDSYYQQIIEILKQGIEAGSFKSIDTELTSRVIFSSLGGLVFHWITGGKAFPIIKAAEELAETILNRIKKN